MAGELVSRLEALRDSIADDEGVRGLLASAEFRAWLDDTIALLRERESSAGLDALAVAPTSTTAADRPSPRQCLYMYARALLGVIAAAASGNALAVLVAFSYFYDVFARCKNPKTPDPPDPNDPNNPPNLDPDDPEWPYDFPGRWPRFRPPGGQVDPENDCKVSFTVTARQNPLRPTTLRVDFGDGAFQDVALSQGRALVDTAFVHQYQHPTLLPDPNVRYTEILMAGIRETGAFDVSFFVHGQPYLEGCGTTCEGPSPSPGQSLSCSG
jgi:hypothetical protein